MLTRARSRSTRISTLGAVLARFRDGERGTSAVEFALIAPLFLAMLIAMAELSLMFFSGQYLETAVQDSARLIMTGQAQTASTAYTADTFKTNVVCPRLSLLLSCNSLSIDVQNFPSGFTGANPGSLFDSSCNLKTSFAFNMGNPSDVVVIRAVYPWQMMAARFFNIACSGGTYWLQASAAFRNEPYK